MPNININGQGSYFGTEARNLVNNLFMSLTLPRNPKLAQSLLAEKRYKFKNTQEYIDIEEQIAILSKKRNVDSARL